MTSQRSGEIERLQKLANQFGSEALGDTPKRAVDWLREIGSLDQAKDLDIVFGRCNFLSILLAGNVTDNNIAEAARIVRDQIKPQLNAVVPMILEPETLPAAREFFSSLHKNLDELLKLAKGELANRPSASNGHTEKLKSLGMPRVPVSNSYIPPYKL